MRDVVVTRVQHSGPPRRSRNFEERLMVRFPSLFRQQAALLQRRPNPRSRLRRAFLRRAVVSGWAAFSRRDFELMLVRYAPDVEVESFPGMQTLDIAGTFRGHVGWLEAYGKLADAWDLMETDPTYILDLGERVLSFGLFRSHARASGVPLEQEFAQVLTAPEGLITHDQVFFSWEEALRAAGLEPDAIALPSRTRAGQAASSAG
jgi:ketosteroid isomerase-like protein